MIQHTFSSSVDLVVRSSFHWATIYSADECHWWCKSSRLENNFHCFTGPLSLRTSASRPENQPQPRPPFVTRKIQLLAYRRLFL
ncbi:hypothetical protein CEXT_144641 [Caerostris extrusa]|uniref:Uncharacterized protein n=1 Tax=Caerostris extrusa TaxID=172846 RepID=A0AAV4XLM5_CAEEX|nr:hypothetical protein CEXT_144641 [Caerostris extrusa]